MRLNLEKFVSSKVQSTEIERAAQEPIDLLQLAEHNSRGLAQRFDALLAHAETRRRHRIRRFAKRVERQGRVSINLRQTVLNSFFIFGEHQNIYEWVAWRARFSRKSAQRLLKQKLGPHYDRRIAFDDSFVCGRALRYGALNIGGLGVTVYGEYCVVLTGHAVRWLQAVYLQADSLMSYLRGSRLDIERLARQVAPHDQRHQLATLKHAADLVDLPEKAWPRLLCSEISFVETLLQGRLMPRHVREVRLASRDFEHRFEHVFEEFRGQLDAASRFLVEDFATLWRQLDEHGIRFEAVE